MMTRAYGWRPDLPDKRDVRYAVRLTSDPLPERVDLSARLPPAWDQGSLGSCTAFALGAAISFERGDGFTPSFLQLYYLAREEQGWEKIDGGAYIRDVCKVGARYGVAGADAWSYAQPWATRPNKRALANALDTRISSYARLSQTLPQLKAALAGGDTVVFGATLYESFEGPRGGVIPMPGTDEEMLGGHAMLLVGYDNDRRMFRVRNSWGAGWGDRGYCWIPYEYVEDDDLCADFWVVKSVTEAAE